MARVRQYKDIDISKFRWLGYVRMWVQRRTRGYLWIGARNSVGSWPGSRGGAAYVTAGGLGSWRAPLVQRHTIQADHIYFHWRFSAPPVLEASRNETTSHAVAYEPPVEIHFHRRLTQ
jgi:hypothetical protein